MIGNLSDGNRPSINAQPAKRAPADWGSEKCPCCGGNCNNAKVICSTCRRDASYSASYARKVAEVERRLQQA